MVVSTIVVLSVLSVVSSAFCATSSVYLVASSVLAVVSFCLPLSDFACSVPHPESDAITAPANKIEISFFFISNTFSFKQNNMSILSLRNLCHADYFAAAFHVVVFMQRNRIVVVI